MASDGDSVRRKVLFEKCGEKESDSADHLPLQDNTHSCNGVRQVLDLKHIIKRQRLRDINEKGVRIRPTGLPLNGDLNRRLIRMKDADLHVTYMFDVADRCIFC